MDGDNMTAPTIGTAVFTAGETAASTVAQDDAVTLADGKKYAKKPVNLDFSGVTFESAGIYRYVITEKTIDGNKHVAYDTQADNIEESGKRYLDVYVGDSDTGLAVSAYVLHTTSGVGTASAENGGTDKSAGFVNQYTSYDFTFGKEVTGNQGSLNKYFKFTLSLTDLQTDANYAVDLTRASPSVPASAESTNTSYLGVENPSSVTASAQPVVFYLKDGEYITIKGLPPGYRYALNEASDETATEYTPTGKILATDNAGGVAYTDDTRNTSGVNRDIKTGYTNHRAGIIPTGILMTVAPFAAGLLLFGALFFFLAARNKRKR